MFLINKKFSLVELLVVLAILLFLLTLLPSGLTKIIETSKRAECGSRLRQLMMAADLYREDNSKYYFEWNNLQHITGATFGGYFNPNLTYENWWNPDIYGSYLGVEDLGSLEDSGIVDPGRKYFSGEFPELAGYPCLVNSGENWGLQGTLFPNVFMRDRHPNPSLALVSHCSTAASYHTAYGLPLGIFVGSHFMDRSGDDVLPMNVDTSPGPLLGEYFIGSNMIMGDGHLKWIVFFESGYGGHERKFNFSENFAFQLPRVNFDGKYYSVFRPYSTKMSGGVHVNQKR